MGSQQLLPQAGQLVDHHQQLELLLSQRLWGTWRGWKCQVLVFCYAAPLHAVMLKNDHVMCPKIFLLSPLKKTYYINTI